MRLPASVIQSILEGAERLGEGAYGVVYTRRIDGEMACIKIYKKSSASALRSMLVEGYWLQQLETSCVPGTPRLLHYCTSPVTLITTYDGPNTLDTLLEEVPMPLTELLAVDILHQVAVSLKGMSECGIAHNDLKSDNVVLRAEGSRYIATTIDLGNASRIGVAPYGPMDGAEFPHIAPELTRGLDVAPNSDVYSLGYMMWTVALQVPLLDGGLIELITDALQTDPADRISIAALEEGLRGVLWSLAKQSFNIYFDDEGSSDSSRGELEVSASSSPAASNTSFSPRNLTGPSGSSNSASPEVITSADSPEESPSEVITISETSASCNSRGKKRKLSASSSSSSFGQKTQKKSRNG